PSVGRFGKPSYRRLIPGGSINKRAGPSKNQISRTAPRFNETNLQVFSLRNPRPPTCGNSITSARFFLHLDLLQSPSRFLTDLLVGVLLGMVINQGVGAPDLEGLRTDITQGSDRSQADPELGQVGVGQGTHERFHSGLADFAQHLGRLRQELL